jgi:hypothetical protein
MANEFIARKGLIALDNSTISGSLIINKSGSTVFDIQGSQGQLFSVTDSLTGTLMSVNDISGLPILEVSSDDKVVMGTFGAPGLTVSGSSISATGSLSGSFTGSGTITNALTASSITPLVQNVTITGSATISNTLTFTAPGVINALVMNNHNIHNVNNITIADPGPNEGIEWLGGSGWKIWESPNDLTTNTGGNLQIVSGSTRVLTVGTDRVINVPNGELNITSSAAGPTVLLYDSTAGNDPYIRFVPATTANAFAVGVDDSDADKFKISYGTNAALGTNDRLTISSSGNVGIGTTNPLAKLHLAYVTADSTSTGVSYAGIRLDRSGANSDAFASGILYTAFNNKGGFVGATGNGIVFQTYDGATATNQLIISSSGNVGIGTITPTLAKLQISTVGNGSASLDAAGSSFNGVHAILPGRIYVGAASTGYPQIMYNAVPSQSATWRYAGNDTAWAIDMGGSNQMRFRYAGAGTAGNNITWNNIMVLSSGSGNVGIGTTSPNARLDVNGNAIITGSLTVTGTIIAQKFEAQLISSSIIYESGSTKFGDSLDDVHQRTGSMFISGGIDIKGSSTFSGSLNLNNGVGINFVDQRGIYPTNVNSAFVWTLNNDNARIYAQQPSSDAIDFVFKIADNVDSNDRYIYWIDNYLGAATDAYPLWMDGGKFVVNYLNHYNSSAANNVDFYVLSSGSTNLNSPLLFADVSANNVGIGTNNPIRRLQIDAAGASNLEVPLMLTSAGSTATRVGIQFASSSIGSGRTHALHHRVGSPTVEWILGTSAGESSTWNFQPKDDGDFKITLSTPFNGGTARIHTGLSQSLFALGAGAASNHLVISSSGNVGIGTSTPSAKLDVVGNTRIGDTSVNLRLNRVSSNVIADANYFVASTNSPIQTWVEGAFLTGERTGTVTVPNSGRAYYEEYFGNGVLTHKAFGFISKTSGSTFNNTDFTASLAINQGGNVGIGTTSPNARLDVNGNTIVTGSLTVTGTIIAQEFKAELVSSSIIYESGSTKFGDSLDDVHQRTGSLNISGSQNLVGELSITSSAAGPTVLLYDSTAGNDPYIRFVPATAGNAFAIGIDDSDADKFKISYGTSAVLGTNDRLTISSSGNVGINESSPSQRLSIIGNVLISGSTADLFLQSNNDTFVQSWRTNGNNIMAHTWGGGIKNYFDSNHRLHFGDFSSGTGTNHLVRDPIIGKSGSETTASLAIWTANIARLFVSSSGDIGIGTSTPATRLSIHGGYAALNLPVSDGLNLASIASSPDRAQIWWGDNTGWRLNFGTRNSSGNFVPRVTMVDTGNVGIGTLNPENALHLVTSTTDVSQQLLVQNSSTGDSAIKFNISGDTYSIGIDNSDEDKFKISYGNLGTNDRITIDVSGNVGIGTNTPTYKLDIDDNATIGAGLRVTGGGTGTDFVTFIRDVGGSGTISFNAENSRPQIKFIGANTFAVGESGSSFVIADDTTLSAGGTSGTQRLVINSSGNIGIGTASPSIRLEVSGSIGAPNFTSGFTGGSWRLDYSPTSSSLEVDNLTVRGTMRVYELLINQIRATNGTLFVSSVGKVETVTGTSPTFFLSFDTGSGGTLGHGFAVGDIIRAQRVNPGNPSSFVYRSDLTVTGISANGKFVTASLQGSTTAPSGGMEFVRLGNTSSLSNRQGTVYLTADDTNAPFIDVIDGVASHADWNTASGSNRLKTRMGRLNGITSTNFGALSGYGFYASGSAFLEGGINATTGRIANWVISGNSITSSNLHLTSSNGGVIRMGSTLPASHTSGTGIFLSGSGQVLIGNATGNRIQFDGSNVTISSSNAVLKGNSVEISGSNFHLLNGNITASNVNLSGNITATTGNIGGFAITANALTGSGFYISGGAAATGFFISSSGFNVKGNGNITASAGRIGGFNITNDVLSGTGFLLSGSATGTGFFISSSGFNVKANGNITASAGRIGGFTITNDVLSGTGFLLSGSATGTGFFISSSGFNVKANGNITASAGLVGGWNLATASLSQGDVNLLATSVSGGLFVTSGSERILTVGNFNNVTVSTSPGIFATASLFRSSSNGTATVVSSSNSLTISRLTSTVPTDFVTTTVTQSLGTIPAGRVIALTYTYADLTNYTSSAVGVTWNNTSPSHTSQTTLVGPSSNSTNLLPTTSSFVTVGGVSGGKGTLNFTASLVNNLNRISGNTPPDPYVDNVIFKVYNKDNTVIYNGDLGNVSIPIDYYGNTTTSIKFEADVLWRAGEDNFTITSSLNITGITSDIFVPTVFSASISSSGGTSLINSYQHNSRSPYSKVYASSIPVPTQLTNAKLIFTVRQLGSGSAYTNLPSYKISDILVSADVPKVNISRNQAIFYNSPLQYMQWTTSSFDIKGDIDATSLTVRGTTNLLGPVTIEGDISAHPDVQGASSTGNSAGTVVQNLTFDAFGHTTGVSTTNLDSRYQPVGSYVTLGTNQTISGVKSFAPSSTPTIILGASASPFSGSISFKGTDPLAPGSPVTTIIRIQDQTALTGLGGVTYTLNLPIQNGTLATTGDITTGTITGTLPVNKGGTGKTSLTSDRLLTGNGISAIVDEANLTFDGSLLTVTGALTTTGNAKLGDATADAHTVTGSFGISGSLSVNGTSTATTTTTTGTTTTNTLAVGTQASKATISYTTNTARTLTIPDVAGNRTFSFIDQAETINGAKTFGADITISKGTGIPSAVVSSGTASDLILRSNTGNVILSGSSTSNISFVDAGTTNMFISASGQVGIGTITPRTPLQVNGQISGSSVRAAYSSSDGSAGLTTSFSVLDASANQLDLVFKDGLLISVTQP